MEGDVQELGRRLVGVWTTEATHPLLPGAVIRGSSEIEWLDGEKFLILRSGYDHADIPNAISIIGDIDGLSMHYFDSRGVHRIYEVTVSDDAWQISMSSDASAGSFASPNAPFSQRVVFTFENGDQTMSGRGSLSHDDVNWEDDLQIRYDRI